MKVRILSGNRAGEIEEQDLVTAQNNIASGFAESVPEPRHEKDEHHEDGPEHEKDEHHEDESGTRHEPKKKPARKK